MNKINWNEKMVFVTKGDGEKWEKGYRVYIQRVKQADGKWSMPFITFVNDCDKIHFNDSLSICISEYYGKAETLINMIRFARENGWIKEGE